MMYYKMRRIKVIVIILVLLMTGSLFSSYHDTVSSTDKQTPPFVARRKQLFHPGVW